MFSDITFLHVNKTLQCKACTVVMDHDQCNQPSCPSQLLPLVLHSYPCSQPALHCLCVLLQGKPGAHLV